MEDIITVENLAYAYPDLDGQKGTRVFENLNLTIESGSFVAILGTNGCGKSTLAKHFNSILLPSGGKVYVDGIDTSDLNRIMAVRRCVGMVFQNPDNQIVATVVEEDVAFGLENNGVPPREIRVRIDEALEAVGMTKYAKKAPHMLSGGQKQRVAIARAMVNDPALILADEPTGALDSETSRVVMDLFHEMHEKYHKTIVLITHNPALAEECQRVLTLHDGRIIAERKGSGVRGAL